MKIGDKIYHYRIKLDFLKDNVEQSIGEHTIIGANNHRICINDEVFTSLKIKGYYRGDKEEFNSVSTYESKYGGYWDYIQSELYTATPSKKIAYRRMKKSLEKFIYEKHGRYCNAITFLDQIKI